ncbi:MAG: hypothetical protein K0R54_140 [Clostridiaceae bacterium]|jgi:hypothetical protein|nr:hypothetical protein [Clostridiaceae bacterium]
MEKELHIWMGENYLNKDDLLITYDSTQKALFSYAERVDTVQTHFCSTMWFEYGYRIFVHMLNNDVVEIKLGQNDCTTREIRKSNNLEKLLLANHFGFATR